MELNITSRSGPSRLYEGIGRYLRTGFQALSIVLGLQPPAALRLWCAMHAETNVSTNTIVQYNGNPASAVIRQRYGHMRMMQAAHEPNGSTFDDPGAL